MTFYPGTITAGGIAVPYAVINSITVRDLQFSGILVYIFLI
jgi:hypothetical protein